MIPVNQPVLAGNEKKYLNECIETGWISSEGPFVKRFEEAFAARVGRKYGVAVTNGTAALEASMAAIGIGPGDEVILPTFCIISCAAAVVRNGGTPVLVDCDADTWNMDVNQVADAITPKTKAILVVHTYGLPVDMDPILHLAEKHGIAIVEDAAEMIGQTYRNRPCGSFGALSTFSFYPNKHVTSGEGGMIVTDDPELYERCQSLRNLCFQRERRFVHEELGWNLRMTNLQAAVGLAQLEQLDANIVAKRSIGNRYLNGLSHLTDYLQLPTTSTDFAENIYWVFGLVVRPESPRSKDDLVAGLQEQKIGTRPFFWPMHEQPVFQKKGWFKGQQFPVAEDIARNGFYLPSGLGLQPNELELVVEHVNRLLNS